MQFLSSEKNKILVIGILLCIIVFLFPLWYEDFWNRGLFDSSDPGYPYLNYPMSTQFSFIMCAPKPYESPALSQYNLRHFPMRINWRTTLEEISVIMLATAFLYLAAKNKASVTRLLLYTALWTPFILPYVIGHFTGPQLIYIYFFADWGHIKIPYPVRVAIVLLFYLLAAAICWGIYLLIARFCRLFKSEAEVFPD